MLLAIDPGRFTGWALFSDVTLIHCGITRPEFWGNLVLENHSQSILIEEPTIYAHSKVAPASVMALQLKVGELKGRFEAAGCRVELVQPRTWKGQTPKKIHNARTFAALTIEERKLARGQRHDVLDAIGLGLWKLGRMK